MGLRSGVMMVGMLLGASSVSSYAATFEVPRNFEIMYVDLQSPSSFGGDFKTEVDPGIHQFVVRFNQRVGGGSNGEHFQSEPYIIDIDVPKDSYITLKAPYFFQKSNAAKYAKAPEFSLIEKDQSNKLDYKIRMLPKKSGLQQSRDIESEVRHFTSTYKTTKSDGPAPASETVVATEELEMLKFWYNKADASTRKDMRIWMVDHSHQAKTESTAFEMLGFWFEKASKNDQKAFQIWLLNE